MSSPQRLGRAPARARLAFVVLAVTSSFLVTGAAGANAPNEGGVTSSDGAAPYAKLAPAALTSAKLDRRDSALTACFKDKCRDIGKNARALIANLPRMGPLDLMLVVRRTGGASDD